MSFSLFVKKEEIGLLIDIGNGSVSGALVSFGESKPALLYAVRKPFSINDKFDSGKLINSMTISLDEILSSVAKTGKKISTVMISLSSPWFASKTKNLHLTQNIPFIISEKFIQSVLKIEEKKFEKDLINGEYENLFDKNTKIVENSVVNTKINGYNIAQCLGKKTKIFDASVYMSVASKSVTDTICDKIFKHIHIGRNRIYIHTFPLISFSVVRDLFPSVDNFLLMNVASETTDISLISGDSIVKTLSFPSGRNFVIRQICKTFDAPPEIAESFLRSFNSEKIDDQTSLRIESALSEAEKEWSIYFEDALAEISKNNAVPSRLYMTAEADVVPVYRRFLKLPKTDGTSVFRKSAEIVHINADALSAVYLDNPRFPSNEFIGILAVFFEKVKNKAATY